MNMLVCLVAFMCGVVMGAAGTSDVKNNGGLKKSFYGGPSAHPADMPLPDLISSLREHLAALNDVIHIFGDLQNKGIDSAVDNLLNKLDDATTTATPETTTAWLDWFDRGTGNERSSSIKQKRLSELVLKKLRAIANEE